MPRKGAVRKRLRSTRCPHGVQRCAPPQMLGTPAARCGKSRGWKPIWSSLCICWACESQSQRALWTTRAHRAHGAPCLPKPHNGRSSPLWPIVRYAESKYLGLSGYLGLGDPTRDPSALRTVRLVVQGVRAVTSLDGLGPDRIGLNAARPPPAWERPRGIRQTVRRVSRSPRPSPYGDRRGRAARRWRSRRGRPPRGSAIETSRVMSRVVVVPSAAVVVTDGVDSPGDRARDGAVPVGLDAARAADVGQREGHSRTPIARSPRRLRSVSAEALGGGPVDRHGVAVDAVVTARSAASSSRRREPSASRRRSTPERTSTLKPVAPVAVGLRPPARAHELDRRDAREARREAPAGDGPRAVRRERVDERRGVVRPRRRAAGAREERGVPVARAARSRPRRAPRRRPRLRGRRRRGRDRRGDDEAASSVSAVAVADRVDRGGRVAAGEDEEGEGGGEGREGTRCVMGAEAGERDVKMGHPQVRSVSIGRDLDSACGEPVSAAAIIARIVTRAPRVATAIPAPAATSPPTRCGGPGA